MIIGLSNAEKSLLTSLSNGISKILIFKSVPYPSAVSFILKNNNTVTIRARGEEVAFKFEVFPIIVTDEVVNSVPVQLIELDNKNQHFKINILQKSEWSTPSSQEEKEQALGDSTNSTTQYEGKATDIPSNAINQVTLHAGIELINTEGWQFVVASSMFPFALYVSDCEFSEDFDLNIYQQKALIEE